MNGSVKMVTLVVGLVLSVIGLVMDNWKLATLGNSIAIFGSLFG